MHIQGSTCRIAYGNTKTKNLVLVEGRSLGGIGSFGEADSTEDFCPSAFPSESVKSPKNCLHSSLNSESEFDVNGPPATMKFQGPPATGGGKDLTSSP